MMPTIKMCIRDSLQGGPLGEIPFLPLQAAQAEGKYAEGTQPPHNFFDLSETPFKKFSSPSYGV